MVHATHRPSEAAAAAAAHLDGSMAHQANVQLRHQRIEPPPCGHAKLRKTCVLCSIQRRHGDTAPSSPDEGRASTGNPPAAWRLITFATGFARVRTSRPPSFANGTACCERTTPRLTARTYSPHDRRQQHPPCLSTVESPKPNVRAREQWSHHGSDAGAMCVAAPLSCFCRARVVSLRPNASHCCCKPLV
jgi:hypothetical protein